MTTNTAIIAGKHKKPIIIDSHFLLNNSEKPIIIFCHGYKGFKDWGAWNLMASTFAQVGFFFVRFNFSHNGGTVEQPIDFPDLDAFGYNNYSKELDDLASVIDWVCNNNKLEKEINRNNITLIGHSRGGGIVSIKAEEDLRIKQVISLAGVSDYKVRFPSGNNFERWKNDGVYFVENGRTKQQMPHYFQFFEDFIANEDKLTIKRAVKNLKIPHLVIHGDEDTSVSIGEAKQLHKWNPKSELVIVKGANHVFGASHPWNNDFLPDHLHDVIKNIIAFLK